MFGAAVLMGMLSLAVHASQRHNSRPPAEKSYVSALLMSDIHFDPFQDPAKVEQLAAVSINDWPAILSGPPSSDQASAFARVRDKCGKEVFDTSPQLLAAAVNAVSAKQKSIGFVVLTGDLVAHDFFCRFEATLPGRSPQEAQAFLERTIEYVIQTLSRAVTPRPMYVALGNNDSDCGDYRLDRNDPLFGHLLRTVARAARVPESVLLAQGFAIGGRFTAMLPAPMRNTKIVVMDDLPFSSRFQNCTGSQDSELLDSDLSWLKDQLEAARIRRQKVWFAAHIPPGVDPRPTLFGMDICKSRKPVMLLSSDALAGALGGFSDVVRLALFGHTHMDEMRILLHPSADGSALGMPAEGVPVKLIPSISPVAGNRPSFLIAQVDAITGLMSDYTQYTVSDSDEVGGAWKSSYSFRLAYAEPSFSVSALQDLVSRFRTDSPEARMESFRYIDRYSSGAPKFGIAPVWNSYQCVFKSERPDEYLDCACPADRSTIERR